MEIQGNIKLLSETKEYGDNGFKKREMVITTQEQYPQDIIIEFVQDKCSLLDKFKVGQYVNVGFNLRGREWINPEGVAKYFNSLNGWRISLFNKQEKTEDTSVKEDLPF